MDLNGKNIVDAASITNSGTLKLTGGETLSATPTNNAGSTVEYTGGSTYTLNSWTYKNLKINGNNGTFSLPGNTSLGEGLTVAAGTLSQGSYTLTATNLATISGGYYTAGNATSTFNGGLTISGGTFTGSTGAIDVNGDVTLSAGALTAPSGDFTVSGNWTTSGSPTFTPGTNTVTLDTSGTSTISGTNTFYKLKCIVADKIIVFPESSITTVSGILTLLGGANSHNIVLKSSGAGTDGSKSSKARVDIASVNDNNNHAYVQYVSVYDNDATNGTASPIQTQDSTDGGNTGGWRFCSSDVVAPTITSCGNNQIGSSNSSCQVAVPNFTSGVSATDNCSSIESLIKTQTPEANTAVGVGITTVTVTVKDEANNSVTCTRTFTVSDNTAPVITSCGSAQSASVDVNCHASVPDFTGVTATDNCTTSGSLTKTQSPSAGTTVGIGVTTVTVTVKDAVNNITTCMNTFTVSDATVPSITSCGSNQTGSASSNCQAAVPDFTGSVSATDNCTSSESLVITQTPEATQTTVGVGVTTVTITVKDAANNSVTCTRTFTVTSDLTATASNDGPIYINADLHLTGGPSGSGMSYSWSGPNSFTSSSQSPTISNAPAAATGLYTLTVTNSSGCTDHATTNVIVGTRDWAEYSVTIVIPNLVEITSPSFAAYTPPSVDDGDDVREYTISDSSFTGYNHYDSGDTFQVTAVLLDDDETIADDYDSPPVRVVSVVGDTITLVNAYDGAGTNIHGVAGKLTRVQSAETLKHYLDQILPNRGTHPVSIANHPDSNTINLYLGDPCPDEANCSAVSTAHGWIKTARESLTDEDAFTIGRLPGDDFYIAGKTELATEFGVYEFLEKYGRVRWVLPDSTFNAADANRLFPNLSLTNTQTYSVPGDEYTSLSTLVLDLTTPDVHAPVYLTRGGSGTSWAAYKSVGLDWLRKLRMHERVESGHNIPNVFVASRIINSHEHGPIFPCPSGHTCTSQSAVDCSDKDNRYVPCDTCSDHTGVCDEDGGWTPNFAAEGADTVAISNINASVKKLALHPTFSIALSDTKANLDQAYTTDDLLCTSYFNWANALATDLGTFDLGTLAYSQTRWPPSSYVVNSLKLKPHVVPFLAFERLRTIYHVDSAYTQEDIWSGAEGRRTKWDRVRDSSTGTLGIHDYVTSELTPIVYPSHMKTYLSDDAANHIVHAYDEFYPNYSEAFKFYAYMKLLWDPTLAEYPTAGGLTQVQVLLADWCQAAVGTEAKSDLYNFFKQYDDYWSSPDQRSLPYLSYLNGTANDQFITATGTSVISAAVGHTSVTFSGLSIASTSWPITAKMTTPDQIPVVYESAPIKNPPVIDSPLPCITSVRVSGLLAGATHVGLYLNGSGSELDGADITGSPTYKDITLTSGHSFHEGDVLVARETTPDTVLSTSATIGEYPLQIVGSPAMTVLVNSNCTAGANQLTLTTNAPAGVTPHWWLDNSGASTEGGTVSFAETDCDSAPVITANNTSITLYYKPEIGDSGPDSFAIHVSFDCGEHTYQYNGTVHVGIGSQQVLQWRSIRTHSSIGDLPIVLNPTATGNDSVANGGPSIETRGTGSALAPRGISRIQVEFGGPVTLASNPTSHVAVIGYETTYPEGVPTLGSPSSKSPDTVAMIDSNTMEMTFATPLPDQGCYVITLDDDELLSGDITISGDVDVVVRALSGDGTLSGTVTTADMAITTSKAHAATPLDAGNNVGNAIYDYNLSGFINGSDISYIYARVNGSANTLSAICP